MSRGSLDCIDVVPSRPESGGRPAQRFARSQAVVGCTGPQQVDRDGVQRASLSGRLVGSLDGAASRRRKREPSRPRTMSGLCRCSRCFSRVQTMPRIPIRRTLNANVLSSGAAALVRAVCVRTMTLPVLCKERHSVPNTPLNEIACGSVRHKDRSAPPLVRKHPCIGCGSMSMQPA